MDAGAGVARRFATISGELLSEPDEPATLGRIGAGAIEVVPGADFCALALLRRRGKIETAASTDPVADEVDALQYSLNEGPILDAVLETGSVLARDLRDEPRWPHWAPRAAERGIRASLSIRLASRHESLGALNLYGSQPGAFDEDSIDLGLIYARHATEAVRQARLATGLRVALESRHLIGMAQGVVAARYDLSYERAFEVLHRYSNEHNVKLRMVAQQVVEQRRLPDASRGQTRPA